LGHFLKLASSHFLTFIRNHGNVISIVAILFALGTNALKEISNDSGKDRVTKLENAKILYDDRVHFQELKTEIDTILNRLKTSDDQKTGGQTMRDLFEGTKNELDGTVELMLMLDEKLAENPTWADAIVDRFKFGAPVHETTIFTDPVAQIDHDYTKLLYDANRVVINGQVSEKDIAPWKGRFDDLTRRIRVKTFTLLEKLIFETTKARARVIFFNNLNLVVFPLGIIVALLGQIAKPKDEPATAT
jgi:hypothetical protein